MSAVNSCCLTDEGRIGLFNWSIPWSTIALLSAALVADEPIRIMWFILSDELESEVCERRDRQNWK